MASRFADLGDRIDHRLGHTGPHRAASLSHRDLKSAGDEHADDARRSGRDGQTLEQAADRGQVPQAVAEHEQAEGGQRPDVPERERRGEVAGGDVPAAERAFVVTARGSWPL
jgi:hypothetical protein